MNKNLPNVGDVVQGTVVRVYRNYAIMLFDAGYTGLLHISELSHKFIRSFSGYCKAGNIYTVNVIEVDEEKGAVKVSLKQMSSQDRKKALQPSPIDSEQVDFAALESKLPNWVND
ncbi:MAG: S1 RNA-binding domain-containing protein [Bacilli bacterium]|nr:S1 RNA-binding domain-containing protein [Bacilli bacterium]